MGIRFQNVSKSFGSKKILKSISLELEQGKTHVLLGSSGSGKSTLLRIVAGVTSPESGEVYIEDQRMTPEHQRQLARKIGYVIQDGGLFPHLTAEDNVTLVSRTFGWTKEQKKERVKELREWLNLDPSILKRYPRELSGGQRQRLGMMRACFLDPSVMLLDEPLGALDPIIRTDLQKELKDLFNKLNKTVVIVTHDINEAAFFGQTVTLLKEGRIIQHGTFEDLRERPSDPYVTEFIHAQRQHCMPTEGRP